MNELSPNPGTAEGACPFSITDYAEKEPWDAYEAQRAKAPVIWDAKLESWVLFDYRDCLMVEMNEKKFRNVYQGVPQIVIDLKGGGKNITVMAGEEHAKMRKFLLSLFTPDKVEIYNRTVIQPVVDMLMQRMLAKGTGKAELCTEFGDQIPPRVILALFGMPWEDDELVARTLHLHEEIMEVLGSGFRTEEMRQKGVRVSKEINAILKPYLEDRRDNPRDDFLSAVWRDAPQFLGEELDLADAIACCRELYLGGADTTVHALANLFYLVMTDAEVRTRLHDDFEGNAEQIIEETMRIYGSVMWRYRVTNQDTEIGGVMIPKDSRLILLHSAANRDAKKYACPHSVDHDRKPANDHLAFNKGPRACLGLNLAKAEMRIALKSWLENMPNAALDPNEEPPHFASLFMRSWRPLHTTY
jgi:cytochrome P450